MADKKDAKGGGEDRARVRTYSPSGVMPVYTSGPLMDGNGDAVSLPSTTTVTTVSTTTVTTTVPQVNVTNSMA